MPIADAMALVAASVDRRNGLASCGEVLGLAAAAKLAASALEIAFLEIGSDGEHSLTQQRLSSF